MKCGVFKSRGKLVIVIPSSSVSKALPLIEGAEWGDKPPFLLICRPAELSKSLGGLMAWVGLAFRLRGERRRAEMVADLYSALSLLSGFDRIEIKAGSGWGGLSLKIRIERKGEVRWEGEDTRSPLSSWR